MTVVFVRPTKRDAVLERERKYRLSNSDLVMKSAAPVFVDEHLCFDIIRLLGMRVSRRKEQGWRCSWRKNGRIFAPKTEPSLAIQEGNKEDLGKIC